MPRINFPGGVGATLGAALTSGGTTITLTEALAGVATLTAGQFVELIIDPLRDGAAVFQAAGSGGGEVSQGVTAPEIVHLTAYTAGATTGTILRAQGGTAAVAHNLGAPVVLAPYADTDALEHDTASATGAALAVTLQNRTGTVTTEALTTAAGADVVYVVTNAAVTASSVVIVSLVGGTNTTLPVYVRSVVPGSGSFTVNLRNAHASAALNGTLIFAFAILN